MGDEVYRPKMSAARAEALRRWHEAASDELHRLGDHRVEHLGLDLMVPDQVFPPAPMSRLLGRAVLDEVRPGDRVLDMGTGCGVNAILAARTAHRVVAVDVNPRAVDAARSNVEHHGVASRVVCLESDVFEAVEGTFDLIVFDPPFRWFRPRDLLETAFADEGYRTLSRFMDQAPARLDPGGRVLLFFGTSGDMDHLRHLIDRSGLTAEPLASQDLVKDGLTVTYVVFKLTT